MPKKIKSPKPTLDRHKLTELDKEQLCDFAYFALGDPRLTAYEANFVSSMKNISQFKVVYITKKQESIINQIKQKISYGKDQPLDLPDDDFEETTEDDTDKEETDRILITTDDFLDFENWERK